MTTSKINVAEIAYATSESSASITCDKVATAVPPQIYKMIAIYASLSQIPVPAEINELSFQSILNSFPNR